MRSLFVLLAVGLLGGCITACGSTGKTTDSAASTPSSRAARTGRVATSGSGASTTTSSAVGSASTRRYLKDPDNDIGGPRENSGYRDTDDSRILAYYGHPASAAETRTVSLIAKRYYALAAREEGKGACSMLSPSLVKSIPVVYEQFGASYMRGVKGCPALLSRVFKHLHRELTSPIAVTGVLVKEDHAYALLGSTKIPASFIALLHEHGTWTIDRLIGAPII